MSGNWLTDPHYREETDSWFPPIFTSTEDLARRQREERKANVKRDPVITKIRQRPVDRGNWHADRAIDLLAKTALTEAQKTRLRELLG